MAARKPMPTIGPARPTKDQPIAGVVLPPLLPGLSRRNKSIKIKGTRFQPPTPGEIIDNKAKLEGAMLSMKVLQLLGKGRTYLDLSAELDLSPKDAFDAVVKAIQAYCPNLQELAKEVKDIELQKLDHLERTIWQQLGPDGEGQGMLFDEEGNIVPNPKLDGAFVDALLKVQKARRELLGLDAAKRMESKHEEIRRMYIGVGPDDI